MGTGAAHCARRPWQAAPVRHRAHTTRGCESLQAHVTGLQPDATASPKGGVESSTRWKTSPYARNSIRPVRLASLLGKGEAQTDKEGHHAEVAYQSDGVGRMGGWRQNGPKVE